MDCSDVKKCTGCEEIKPIGEFGEEKTGKPKAKCKQCTLSYQRLWRAEKKKNRVISQENRDFFRLGTTAKDDLVRDLVKALGVMERANKALLEVLKEADIRDAKKGRIPA